MTIITATSVAAPVICTHMFNMATIPAVTILLPIVIMAVIHAARCCH